MCSNNYNCNIKKYKKQSTNNLNSYDTIENIENKIEYIKKNIENGTYFVDTNKLALSLLGNVANLLSSFEVDNLDS